MDDARRFEGSPLWEFLREPLERAVARAAAAAPQPYIWGNAGPGTITVKQIPSVVPMSSQQWADLLGFEDAIRRAAEIRQYLRIELEMVDPVVAYLIRRAYAMRVVAAELRYHREHEAQRCPHCGCHPDEHGRDW